MDEYRKYGKYRAKVIHKDQSASVPGAVMIQFDNYPNEKVLATPCFAPGCFYVPKEGDKVWVEFEEGDPNKPVWTGVFYYGDNDPKPPKQASDASDAYKKVCTRSGHVVTIDDDGSSATIAYENNQIAIKKDSVVLSCGSTTSITIKDGSIVLSCGNSKIEMAATGTKIADQAGASRPVVLDDGLWLKALSAHMHTVQGPAGPTTPAVLPPAPQPLVSAVLQPTVTSSS